MHSRETNSNYLVRVHLNLRFVIVNFSCAFYFILISRLSFFRILSYVANNIKVKIEKRTQLRLT